VRFHGLSAGDFICHRNFMEPVARMTVKPTDQPFERTAWSETDTGLWTLFGEDPNDDRQDRGHVLCEDSGDFLATVPDGPIMSRGQHFNSLIEAMRAVEAGLPERQTEDLLGDERDALKKAKGEGALSIDLGRTLRRRKGLDGFIGVLRAKGFKD
jgi:hypothetical protein